MMKGGRNIVVNGRPFRWHFILRGIEVRPVQRTTQGTLRVGIGVKEHLSEPEPWEFDAYDRYRQPSITPKDIETIITGSIDQGWNPDAKALFTLTTPIDLANYFARGWIDEC